MNDYTKKNNIAFKIDVNCGAKRSNFPLLDNIETTASKKTGLEPSICKGSSDFSRVEALEDKITELFKNKTTITDHQTIPFFSNEGEILNDKKTNWRDLKLQSVAVSNVLDNEGRAERMSCCASSLTFGINEKNEKKLLYSVFCRDRMCPACQKRKSLATFFQVFNIVKLILNDKPSSRFLFLTLTVPNVKYEYLDFAIKNLMSSFKRMTNTKRFKSSVLGFFRGLEVTYNEKTDTYHPHFHILLCVNSNYFTKNYIKQSEWLELWQKATRNPYISQVNIKAIHKNKNRNSDAIASVTAEISKYCTKPSDYLKKQIDGLYVADCKVVNELMLVLKNKRLTAFGGVLKDYYQKLDLVDVEDLDLVDLGENEQFIAIKQQIFTWSVGYNYISK